MNAEDLVSAVIGFIGDQDLLDLDDIRTALRRHVADAGDDALVALRARLTAEDGWTYYERDPLSRRIHHALAETFLAAESELHGTEHLRALAGQPVLLFANHLSYADANAIDVLFERFGIAEVANRLTALAGPKVFTSRERRFSSLCFGNIRVPQSADVASVEAVLSPREVAKAARQAIDVAHRRLIKGDALLLFGEGTRSRTGAMQSMLPGVARYLEGPDAWVVPLALAGSETIFPIDGARLRPGRVVARIGTPVRASEALARTGGDRRQTMDSIGVAIAKLLPQASRGVYE